MKSKEGKLSSARQESSSSKNAKNSTSPSTTGLEVAMVLERGRAKAEQLRKVLRCSAPSLKKLTLAFNKEKARLNSPIRATWFNDTLELTIAPSYNGPVIGHYKKSKKKLSPQVLETAAIVAYQQPVTKAEIDRIRGANSAGSIKLLLEENLIKTAGVKHAPGNPVLYATTSHFLKYFSLHSLKELPPLQEVKHYPFLEFNNMLNPQ